MIDSLKFVQGAIAKKDIVPALTHFRIHQGRIKGYNGTIAICTPIDIGLDCQPKAVDFIKAIQTCAGTVALSMTPAGRLTVKSGKFKVHINCVQEDFPDIEPEGQTVRLEGGILGALKILEPMIAEDASRPWARAILLRGQFAHATNNVVICQYWLGYQFPFDLAIPHAAVNELIRIGIEPESIQFTENSATFHFPDGRWLRTQTAIPDQWPDIARILDKDTDAKDLPGDFTENLEMMRPFADDLNRCYFVEGHMTTHKDDGEGCRIEHSVADVFPVEACFNLDQLRLVAKVATAFDFSNLPALYFGERLRGAIAPMRFV